MGIAEAIERVKRQARQVGLGTVIGGFGEQLRSPAIPSPLRGAAWRIAALLDAACPKTSAAPNERARELIHQDRSAIGRSEGRTKSPAQVQSAAQVDEREPSGTHLTSPTRNGARVVAADEVVPPSSRSSVRELSATAIDTGETPEEPVDGAVVDAVVVGATPTFNATPIEVEPVDATPVDEAAIDALEQIVEVVASDGVVANDPDSASDRDEASAALAIEAARASASPETTAPATDVDELANIGAAIEADVDAVKAESEPAAAAQSGSTSTTPTTGKATKPRAKSASPRKRSTPPPAGASAEPKKEKLAQTSEDAKSLARSNSKSANRRSGAKADTSKKK